MKSIEKILNERFSIHIELDSAGFWVIFKFNLLDNANKKSVFHKKYTQHAVDSFAIKRHLNKSENAFIKQSKKVIEHIEAMEIVFE